VETLAFFSLHFSDTVTDGNADASIDVMNKPFRSSFTAVNSGGRRTC
jgi:hypothetical protein